MHGESGDQPLASEGDKLVTGSASFFMRTSYDEMTDVRADLRLKGFRTRIALLAPAATICLKA